MADRLSVYNGALRLLGQRPLSKLTEEGPSRRALDDTWTDAVRFVLEQGSWNHAIRTGDIEASMDVEPVFGFEYAFAKPADWVRTVQFSNDGSFWPNAGNEDFTDEAGYWNASVDRLFVRYVSDDEAYGRNVGAWSQTFAKAVEAYLAFEASLTINQNKGDRSDIYSLYQSRLKDAKSKDALNEATRRAPTGRWARARQASRFGRYDR